MAEIVAPLDLDSFLLHLLDLRLGIGHRLAGDFASHQFPLGAGLSVKHCNVRIVLDPVHHFLELRFVCLAGNDELDQESDFKFLVMVHGFGR